MKYILMAALLLPFSVQAEEATCEDYANLAKAIMSHRQYANDLIESLEIAKDNRIAREMTIHAYRQPQFSLESNKQDEIRSFGNTFYLACLNNKNK